MLTEVVFASASALALDAGTLTPALALGGALIVGAAVLAALGSPHLPGGDHSHEQPDQRP
jgi:hypothetical protein